MEDSSRGSFRYVVAAVVAAMAAAYVFSIWMATHLGGAWRPGGWEARFEDGQWVVGHVATDGAARDALQEGDRLLAIDGDPRAARTGPFAFGPSLDPDSPYALTVERAGQPITVEIELEFLPAPLHRALGYGLVSLAFLIAAVLMGWSRPGESLNRLGFAAAALVACRFLWLGLLPYAGVGRSAAQQFLSVLFLHDPWHLALGYHFFLAFAGLRDKSRPARAYLRLMYVLAAVFFLTNLPGLCARMIGGEAAIRFGLEYAWWNHLSGFLWFHFRHALDLAALLGMSLVLWFGYRATQDTTTRSRIRWLVAGCVAGMFPLLALQLLYLLLAVPRQARWQEPWANIQFVANLGLIGIPVALAYAFKRHQVLGVRMAVRRGIRYILARNVLQVLLLLPVVGLLSPLIADPNQSVAELFLARPAAVHVALLVALAASLRYRGRLRDWLDRRFFREVYRQEQLQALVSRVAQQESYTDLASVVSTEISAALHPTLIQFLYCSHGSAALQIGFSSDSAVRRNPPRGLRLGQLALSERAPLDVPDPSGPLPPDETRWLDELGVRLVVPLVGGSNALAGLLLLGEKLSEEAYSSSDRELLQTIASQSVLVLQRLWLREQLAEEGRIRREVLARVASSEIELLHECRGCGRCYGPGVEVCAADGDRVTLTLPVERTIGGRYRLECRIGQGGMGAVFEGTDVRLQRAVAVKVLKASLFGDQKALVRFERESRTSARLSHPNVVRVYDFGSLGSDGAFLVMELLEGRTWREMIRREAPIPPATCVPWAKQLLGALEAAHAAGIVHRDLKPENVILANGEGGPEQVKVLDFGLAKLAVEGLDRESSLTATGMIVGTLRYMAPEQLLGGEVDERTDLFAAGLILAESITGRRPFTGRTAMELSHSIARDPLRLPGGSEEVLALEQALRRSLAPERERRFDSARQMREALLGPLSHCPPLVLEQSMLDELPTERRPREEGQGGPDGEGA